jgi:hypothetical protein
VTGKIRTFNIAVFMFSTLLVQSAGICNVHADMGRIYATDAKVSEESQKAIILNNFDEEVLILGTDLKADRTTGILRFIPFPSQPKVSLAPAKAFESVGALIKSHGLKFVTQTKGGHTSAEAVELRFNQRLGAHDITTIRVNNASGFRSWVNEFFKEKGLPQKDTYPEIEGIVDDYVKRGIVWFVFDFVEVIDRARLIEPVQYRFKSNELYYPLKTSNTFDGLGEIDLILVVPGTLCEPLNSYYFGCLGLQNMRATTSSQVTTEELKNILPEAGTFYGKENIFIQLLSYRGKYEFENDISADLSKASPHAIGHAERVDGSPWRFPMEGLIRDLRKRCDLHPDGGTCKGLFWKYYYNKKTGKCEEFVYGGCNGVVPFNTKEECVELCEGKGSSFEREKIEFQKYEPTGKFFSVLIPSGWEQREFDFMKEHNEYEMIIWAPEHRGLEYLLIKVAYYGAEYRTPERFIHDLLNPTFTPQGAERDPLTDVIISGRKAKAIDIRKFRYPIAGMEGEPVRTVERYVVLPAAKGFYVFSYDTLADMAEANRWIFEKILASFDPAVPDKSDSEHIPEISDDEYEVLTDFFSIKKMPEMELPSYFNYVFKGRSVYEKTLLGKKLDGQTLKYLEKVFGKLETFLIEDYKRKNMMEYAIKDRILVPYLRIFSEQETKNALRNLGSGLERFSEKRSEIISLSSIGFSREKNAALFYVSHDASPGTSYFVLMEKTGKKWVIRNAVMDKMTIY